MKIVSAQRLYTLTCGYRIPREDSAFATLKLTFQQVIHTQRSYLSQFAIRFENACAATTNLHSLEIAPSVMG